MTANKSGRASDEAIRRDTLYTQLLNGIPAAGLTLFGIWIVTDPVRRSSPDWVFWFLLVAASWHTVEEYIWPGGFVRWFNSMPFGSSDPDSPLSAHKALVIDGFAILGVMSLFLAFGRTMPVVTFLFGGLIFVNAFFHLIETIKTGRYSPGVVTGTLCIIPVVAWLAYFYANLGIVQPWLLGIMFLLGIALHALFFAYVRRWQRSEGQGAIASGVALS